MNRLYSILIVLYVSSGYSVENLVIIDFINPGIACDYLIVAPDSFVNTALRLANYHNENRSSDVNKPKVVALSTIYKEFKTNDTMFDCIAIKNALHWANRNWTQPFTYAVLVGDDSVGFIANSQQINRGPMPSFATREIFENSIWIDSLDTSQTVEDTNYIWNDYSYSLVDNKDIYEQQSAFMVARIPCENTAQLSTYINNLIKFNNQKNNIWRNNVLFLADDDYQYNSRDPISFYYTSHMLMCDIIAERIKGYFVNKIFAGFYQLDDKMQFSLVTDYYLESIKNGSLLTIYFGHGYHNLLSDERILTGRTISRFDSGYINGCFFSLSCENGAYFQPFKNSMCKQYLFTPSKGFAAYIGSTTIEFARSNEVIAKSFLREIDSLKNKPLGYQWWKSLEPAFASHYSQNYSYLGDPAIYLTKNSHTIQMTRNNGILQNISCKIDNEAFKNIKNYYYQIASINMEYPLDGAWYKFPIEHTIDSSSGIFDKELIINLSESLCYERLKVTVYAWDDSLSWHGELFIDNPVTPAIATLHKPDNAGITINANRIYINTPLQMHDKLTLYTLSGRKVYSQPVRQTQNVIDLKTIVPGSGHFIATLGNCSVPVIIR
jgi:Peptidase family C25